MASSLAAARPVLKWAGGKNQLLAQIARRLPPELKAGKIRRYVEPFIGGGAVFLFVAQNFPVEEFHLADVNEELILLYQTLRDEPDALIEQLSRLEARYLALPPRGRKEFFYRLRADHNAQRAAIDFDHFQPGWIERAAGILFLNRTCYNGLFRVNARGEFNVPHGDYKNPRICDPDNLRAVARLLRRAALRRADFADCRAVVDAETFVYFDPPYRPLSRTAHFTSYSRHEFDDQAQKRLADFCRELDAAGAKLMLSNSDPRNGNPDDDFFDGLYRGFHLHRVSAARMINSDPVGRGPITELLITNYPSPSAPRLIRRFPDGSRLEYDQGAFDEWCVYLTRPHVPRHAPRDLDYFARLQKLAARHTAAKIYGDFIAIYEQTGKEIEPRTLQLIAQTAQTYGADRPEMEILFAIVYAGMVAEENKAHAPLGSA
jgi:DNA adenine methylase